MILVPDSEGNPTGCVVDKAWFDETFPPDMTQATNGSEDGEDKYEEGGWSSSGNSGPESVMRAAETITTDPRTRLNDLRRELPARIEVAAGVYEHAVQSADALLADFETARQLRIDLKEQPLSADQRIEWMERLTKARSAPEASVAALQQVEALILQL